MGGKVRDLDSVGDFNFLLAKLKGASLPKAKVSKIIERLVAAEKGSISLIDFERAIGMPLAGPRPADDGDPGPGDEEGA